MRIRGRRRTVRRILQFLCPYTRTRRIRTGKLFDSSLLIQIPFLFSPCKLGGGELDEFSVDEKPSEAAFIAGSAELKVNAVLVEYVQGLGSASWAEVA